ncbi:MAG: type VI secretion system contractile sheath large subunit [Pirellulales bacterium]|nr:type VI secretion system contractile sheath large subunit [Pirellulales bacterium]
MLPQETGLPTGQLIPKSELGAAGTDADRRPHQRSLLDQLIEAGHVSTSDREQRLGQFLRAITVGQALTLWFGVPASSLEVDTICRHLGRAIVSIDRLLNDQINEILHHPHFQVLEAAWRGLDYLVDQASKNADPKIEIRVLDISWNELESDLERASNFDRSQLFQKVYEQEYGQAGGSPFGLFIGNYEIHPWPSEGHPHDDITTLSRVAGVMAAAFCPFIAAASPTLFGIDDFSQLELVHDLVSGFQERGFIRWRSFRETEDARFIGLVLPRVLMRLPYKLDESRIDRFCFTEDVASADRRKYLWGNAAYAFGEVVMRSFANTGWLAEIRGARPDANWGGLVTGLPVHSFGTDRIGIATKSSTEIMIAENQERDLSYLGFIPLIPCHDTEYSAFYSNSSVQKPAQYDRPAATQNARLSSMLQYTLCVSRFAHYLKVIARNKMGSFADPEQLERLLHDWIVQYVVDDDKAPPETKARRPLREARIEVHKDPARPGHYRCMFHLRPHYQLDNLTAAISLRTRVEPSTH